MSKNIKLIKKLKSIPKDFTYVELRKLMNSLGFIEDNKGKSSGSRVAFYNENTKHIIRLHKPHPNNELKIYQLREIIKFLENIGVI